MPSGPIVAPAQGILCVARFSPTILMLWLGLYCIAVGLSSEALQGLRTAVAQGVQEGVSLAGLSGSGNRSQRGSKDSASSFGSADSKLINPTVVNAANSIAEMEPLEDTLRGQL